MGCSGLSILEESEARVNVWQSLNIDTILLGKKPLFILKMKLIFERVDSQTDVYFRSWQKVDRHSAVQVIQPNRL